MQSFCTLIEHDQVKKMHLKLGDLQHGHVASKMDEFHHPKCSEVASTKVRFLPKVQAQEFFQIF